MFKASRVFQTSEFSGSYSCLGLLTSVERDRREIARCPRSITPTPKPLDLFLTVYSSIFLQNRGLRNHRGGVAPGAVSLPGADGSTC